MKEIWLLIYLVTSVNLGTSSLELEFLSEKECMEAGEWKERIDRERRILKEEDKILWYCRKMEFAPEDVN
jgi:hypothetical protein